MSIFDDIGDIVTGAGKAAGGFLNDIFGAATHEDPEPKGSTTYVDHAAPRGEEWRGTASADTHYGTQSADKIYGQDGNDVLNGNAGDDTLDGGLGDDSVHGGVGNDQVYGSFGHDSLYGDAGKDLLVGGNDGDFLTGGAGADTFKYRATVESTTQDPDRIFDFNRAEGDKVDLQQVAHNAGHALHWESGPSTAAGSVWATGSGSDYKVFVNADGGAADMEIDIHLAPGNATLYQNDFIF